MELSELLEYVTATLKRLNIPYLVTGSMATIAYGEPRFTRDINIVVRLHPGKIDDLAEAFPIEDFYVSTDAMRDAIEHTSQFNILPPDSRSMSWSLKTRISTLPDSIDRESFRSAERSLLRLRLLKT